MLKLQTIKDPRAAETAEGVTNYLGVDMNYPTLFVYDYKTYIKSLAWREKKREWLWRGGPAYCFVCEEPMPKDGRGFNFHHRTYERLMNEKMTDLVLLCRDHHCQLEAEYKEIKGRIPLWDWTYMFISIQRNKLGKKKIVNSVLEKHLPLGEFND